ncbi:hypothetical protein EAH76_08130 [Sphingomonas glacialis]|uniref:Uncharacterized protein n=2 Tax=Sphingomonas glacialis TaxID=658225 RepID=A0A502G111_9SPHN|nr:hypothetical protein EAH76_08130 [Sphingomonas glacialis]
MPIFALAVAIVGCKFDKPVVERLEISVPGLAILIDRKGNGNFKQSSTGKSGRFLLSADKWDALRDRTEPFRLSPDTIPSSKILEHLMHGSRCDGPYATDNGGISFHWIGPSLDQYYDVDYGCDRERYKTRNDELRSILKSLPVPEPDRLP